MDELKEMRAQFQDAIDKAEDVSRHGLGAGTIRNWIEETIRTCRHDIESRKFEHDHDGYLLTLGKLEGLRSLLGRETALVDEGQAASQELQKMEDRVRGSEPN